jgi:hypothetical protein
MTVGETGTEIEIAIENEEDFVAFQFELSYPAGLIPNLAGIVLSERKQDHTFSANIVSNGLLRIVVFSITQKTFSGKSGVILKIPFAVESTLPAGSYALSCGNALISNAQSENVLWNTEGGILTISKAGQTIAMDVVPDKTYGDAPFTLQAQVSSDLPVTYTSSDPGKLFISGNQATILGAGSFTVTAEQPGNDNYSPVSTSCSFQVHKAPLTVTADDKQRVYGDANPAFTLRYDGFKNGETESVLSETPIAFTDAGITDNAGIYEISVSGGSADNYEFTYVSGQLTVNKASLTVTADNKQRVYGDANPAFTLRYDGFKNGETESVLSETPVADAEVIGNAGFYEISVSGGSADNYEFTYISGQLTVDKAPLTVTADDKQRVYGDANPAFTLWYDGFKNGETESVLDELPLITCSADINSPAGFYDIVLSGGSDNNYAYNLVDGTLEVKILNVLEEIPVENISVYPNPVRNELFIKSGTPVEKVTIYDITGVPVMYQQSLNGPSVDVSHLPDGVYFIRIENYTGKFVKK